MKLAEFLSNGKNRRIDLKGVIEPNEFDTDLVKTRLRSVSKRHFENYLLKVNMH